MNPAVKEIIIYAVEFAERELKRFEKEGDQKTVLPILLACELSA